MNPLVYFLIFVKASLFSSGGFGNLPSLHQDLLANGWAHEVDFSKAVAIGQIAPGPNGLWVISLGYLTYGYLGALLALLAITLPPLLVLLFAAVYRRVENHRSVQGLTRGLSLTVFGLLLTVAASATLAPGIDWRGWLIGLGTMILTLTGRVHVIVTLALAALTGLFFLG